MHGITFAIKRAHVAGYRFAFDDFKRHAVGEHEELLEKMTPARFDMMYVLFQSAKRGVARVAQTSLWKTLGLHRTTISKGVSAMVECGYVARDYLDGASKRPFVVLTEKGLAALKMALHIVFNEHRLQTRIDSFAHVYHRASTGRLRFRRGEMNGYLADFAAIGRSFCEHFERPWAAIVYPIDCENEL